MKFTEYKGLDLPKVAEEINHYWDTNNIFEKSVTTRKGNTPFVFYEGPPSANGLPGIHHVMARAIKDIFCRYKTQKGFQVKRKAGWDTHGLPIELSVEKELNITKEAIGKTLSVAAYNKACKEAVMRYTDIWNDMTRKIGYWVNMDDPYITYQPKYMESVWWLLKQIYDKGWLYKGYTIQPYSPKAGTGLSSHELNQPGCYREVTDTTIVAQFKAREDTLPECFQNYGSVYLLAWTTTPWTLPSNTALTVGKKIDYVLVATFNQYTYKSIHVILAKDLVEKQFTGKYILTENQDTLHSFKKEDQKIPYTILAGCKGEDLVGTIYEQLLPYTLPCQNPENAFRVISGDFVTTEEGTGIVHTAPTFGADDARVAKEAIPEVPPMLVNDENGNLVPLVDLQGRFRKELPEIGGKYVKNEYYQPGEAPKRSVDVDIAIQLKEQNKAFKVEKYTHSYPHCWRTDKPILYYPLDSWFIKVTEVKDRMYELNKTINWKPVTTGEGRFGNWLKNANDWNLSRSRFWGIPLPIWRTEDGMEEIIIGSVAQLKVEMKKAIAAGILKKDVFPDFVVDDMSDENYNTIDLHKNIVDTITLVAPSGKPMKREDDLIDVWFDSGAMPYAQWHYPFETPPESAERKQTESVSSKEGLGWAFPADYIAEGVDQTRGWFYTLHAIATLVFDTIAYKNVISNGLVLDKNGQKMSKRLGNSIDPFTTINTYGPDATRWYMISNANPWDNLKFDTEGITEVRRKFFGTLYNTYMFFSLYANIDGFTHKEATIPLRERPEIDRWILSELHTLIKKVDEAYADYEPTKAARALSEFVQENLSNWYVRLSRRRFWKGDYQTDKIAAYQTLYHCLVTVTKLGAPIAPFYMDRLYIDLNRVTSIENTESVHLTYFPKYTPHTVDTSLESKMKKAQIISSLALSLRKKEAIKVRQPLQKIMIPVHNDIEKNEILAVRDLIKSEVNVKEIELIDNTSGLLVKQIKPNFKILGPRFGKDMGTVSRIIQQFRQEDIHHLEKNKITEIEINGKNTILTLDEVDITSQDIEGWTVSSAGGLTVALDVTVTSNLKKEGIARELINRIQNLRKDSGMEVTDKIAIKLQKDDALEQAVAMHLIYIKNETLAKTLHLEETLPYGVDIIFDDINTKLYIEKQK